MLKSDKINNVLQNTPETFYIYVPNLMTNICLNQKMYYLLKIFSFVFFHVLHHQ